MNCEKKKEKAGEEKEEGEWRAFLVQVAAMAFAGIVFFLLLALVVIWLALT